MSSTSASPATASCTTPTLRQALRPRATAHRQLIARAHLAGLRIHGCTITPFGGNSLGSNATTAAARQAVHRWIRTGAEYDSVVDFYAALSDPDDLEGMLPRYDSDDRLHPNDAGMQALAAAVPLRVLDRRSPAGWLSPSR